jgi:serine/threonine-protein kinase
MDTDRSLLFGVLALQADLLDNDRFAEACSAWAARKETPLADLLVERGWLTAEERSHVEFLLDRKLKKHGGDAMATLAAVASDPVRKSLATVADHGIRDTLGSLTIREDPAHAPVAPTPATPETPDRYTLSRLHATGGIGRVWLAHDDRLGRDVALKELRPERADNPTSWSRFLKEAKVTGQLEHPGIVPVYELSRWPADQQPFYTMRFVRGQTMAEAVRLYHQKLAHGEAGPLDLRQLLTAFVGVCNAVAYAHARGVLHRDLKPENVLLGDFGEVIVLDWGLAKVLAEQEDHPSELLPIRTATESGDETVQGQVLGTPAYMAPEQAEGRQDLVETRTDVYGLGAILYEILSGKPPFTGDEISTLLRRVSREPVARPRERSAAAPAALEAICLKALAKRPALRYGSAKEVADEVQRWLADEPVAAYREPWLSRLARWGRRHRPWVVAGVGLLVIAVVALVAGTIAISREQQQTQKALVSESNARRRTRQALDQMSSGVIETWLAQGKLKLDPAQVKFLKDTLALYEDFAQEAGDDPAVREGVADAHRRIGTMNHKLGQTAAAADAYQQAIAHYESLVAEFPTEPRFRRELAGTRNNLGVLYFDTGKANEAEAAYRAALALRQQLVAEFPKEPQYGQDLVAGYNTLANLLSSKGRAKDAEELFQEAIAVAKGLAAEHPDDPKYRNRLALSHRNRGALLLDLNRLKEAEAEYREGIGLMKPLVAQFPTEADYRDGLARDDNGLGQTLAAAGRSSEAESHYRDAILLRKQLAADFPTLTSYRQDLADTQQNLAILCATSGRMQEAEQAFRDALAIRKELAASFPTVTQYRQELASAFNNLGVLLYQTGRPKDAEAAYREGLELARRLAAEAPTIPRYRNLVATWLFNLALLLKELDRIREAEQAYAEALALERQLTAEYPKVPFYRFKLAKVQNGLVTLFQATERPKAAEAACREAIALYAQLSADYPNIPEYRQEHAVSLDNLGKLLRDTGRSGEAEKALEEALALQRNLVRTHPEVPHYGHEQAVTMKLLATVLLDQKAFARARAFLEEARPLHEAAVKSNRSHPDYGSSYRDNRAVLVSILAAQGEPERAKAAAEELARLGLDAGADSYAAARALAACASRVEKESELTPAQRATRARSYADQAMELLRQALTRGYKDAAHLQKDADLAPLRGREEFRRLLSDLERQGQTEKKPQ